ncbi:MAG: aldolase catalytic domain-containing protein [Treponema sp.]|nr:aldolase catalytic domain-containing protein [Treponema sp.]
MNNIKVLDCTLRDGGYCNGWQFGQKNIQKILKSLVDAGTDIIECGFLTNKISYDADISKFTDLSQLQSFIPNNYKKKLLVVMVNYGEYDFSKLPECKDTVIGGIRLAFHKKDMKDSLAACRIIAEKGYKVFIQPMVSLCYSDNEFLDLISKANEINPYAFYIVDSFGEMKRKDLTRLFYMVEHNLNENIQIGFHSHNNMQLAYSNAQRLVELQTTRSLIIDSSVYGMGRGAGNLNTELFTEYLNECRETEYDIKPLLSIIDDVLEGFYQQKRWGYSLPNYISALHSAHPNYAFYLDDKKTLTVESMNEIFLRMDEKKKYEFDKKYIEDLYTSFMATGKELATHKTELKQLLKEKIVLLIAPGKSAENDKEKIVDYSKNENTISVSVNYDYPYFETDFSFISNMRRFREYPKEKHNRCIITANILSDDVYLQIKYRDLLNDVEAVRDNAGLMAIKFLMTYGVKKIVLAGFDGYSHINSENYAEKSMALFTKASLLDAMNKGMGMVLKEYSKQVEIEFLTKPVFYE